MPLKVLQETEVMEVPSQSEHAQLTQHYKDELTHQQYRIVGNHSAVKVCGWTKNMLKGEGGCYKLKFYGIQSHQCMQMTVNLSCANRCTFCWRGYKAPVSKDWNWEVDDPGFIIDEALKAHLKLLEGFGGNPKVPKTLYEKSKHVGHVALSLTGEPIAYPKINELCQKFHERKISTFIVTNAQYPEAIKNLHTITQLYLSLDAPNQELLKKIDLPLFSDFWQRFQDSLKYCAEKKFRTTARLTIVKGLNDVEPENYAKLIVQGDFDFVEVKGYVHVGESRKHLERENMPTMEEVKAFALKVLEFLPEFEYVSQHDPSKVSLLAKKKFHKKTWINYSKFFELVNVKNPPQNLDAMDYATTTLEARESANDFGVEQ